MKYNHIFVKQKKIILILKKIILKFKKKDSLFFYYDFFYFTNWSNNYGSRQVNYLFKENNFFFNLKALLTVAFDFSYRECIRYYCVENLIKKNFYKNLIITYTNNYEIKKKNFFNKIFNSNLNYLKSSLCLAINFDFTFKERTNSHRNLIILNKRKFFIWFNLKFYLLFIKNIMYVFFNKKKIFDKNFYETLDKLLNEIIKNNNIENIFLAFESQPHQNFLIKKIKKKDKNIKIIGYLHSSLPSLPVDFIYKYQPLDSLIVNGKDQANILINYLNWPSNKIQYKPSFRYRKKTKSKFQNIIFLPHAIVNDKLLTNNFEHFLNLQDTKVTSYFKIRNHPLMLKSRRHNNLVKKLWEIQKLKINNSNKKNNFALVLGVSASILEILENGVNVIHICQNEVLESHNEYFWKNINVKRIKKNIFEYSIKKKQNIITFGRDNQFKTAYGL